MHRVLSESESRKALKTGSVDYEAVCKTAPATPGLLIIENGYKLTCGMPAHVFNFDVG